MNNGGLDQWHDFFAAVAGIAATLLGLLFVAVALRPALIADAGPPGLRTWVAQVFHNFVVVLVVGLVLLVPDEGRAALAATLLAVGGTGVVRVGLDARRVRADPAPEWRGATGLLRFAAPLAAYAVAAWVGWRVLRGDAGAVGWLVATVLLLLISATSNCWSLLRAIANLPAADDAA